MQEKRRVLFLFAHLHKGGMQRAVSNISQALPEKYDQYVAYFGTENPGYQYNATQHCFSLPGNRNNGLIGKLGNLARRIHRLRDFVRRYRIDVVVSMGEAANIYSLASRHGAKTIITSRVALDESLHGNALLTSIYRRLVSLLYPHADQIVAVSEELAKTMRVITQGKCDVQSIPNLYHIDKIRIQAKSALPEELAFLENKPFILNAGSLCYQKGQDELLNIFRDIHLRHPMLHLVLLGRGELKIELKQQAEALGVGSQVVFIDFDLNPYRYMSRAQVFALTSRFEGFPNVLAEAMVCGAPVVAFDCTTGPEEILGSNSQHGYLIRNRSSSDFVEAVCSLLDSGELRASFTQRSICRSNNFSASSVVGRWDEVLK